MMQFAVCASEVCFSPSRYTGKERDAESGNDYFGARYYASSMGRWLSPDWSAKVTPVPYAKLDNPQTLNLYAYVGNNPLSRTDPTGHYNTTCSGNDISKCSSDIQNTEANRKANLLSKDPNVRNSAKAMGTFNDGNKVNLRFDSNAHVGKETQDTGSNGKPTDSITVTLPTAGTALSDRGILAHAGSHVEDFQSAMSGGQSLTKFQSEMKAYSTQAGVLLDAPFNEWGNTVHFSDNAASMILFAPDSSANRDINTDSIRTFLGSDSRYGLTEQNQGGPAFVQP